ncbi:hypothetical protein CFH99_22990 [Nocardioides aromaticivorans]|uniref:STAS domain-containing protein n=1 Tax=Nocardioides aromaticivorans TaxID=200618 RepID=A0ABX7PSA3_9ACTN|nr:STAS domain-containing protein [Nocardioides aromaticivorans]QSR28495.1 hypothetical protein CFH99_22990 [Nocardioides aromaticivorans]
MRPPRSPAFSASVRARGADPNGACVDVAGDLDLEARGLLEAAVITCLHARPPRVLLDLHRVTFMDCAGTKGLLACRVRAAAQDARLVVVEPSIAVTRVLTPEVAVVLGVDAASGTSGSVPSRRLECVPCGRRTPHVVGEQTVGTDGRVLVQWWRCTECEEGNAIG